MKVAFTVAKGEKIIFRYDFPADEAWEFPVFSKIALQEFHKQCPDVSLLDDDVQMSFSGIDDSDRT